MATGTAADTTRLMRSLVESAVLAPSSHNTQPWRFRLNGGRLELRADRSRSLPVNDPHDRELTISCGAAWFNVRVAAAHHGVALHRSLLPDGGAGDVLATATVGGGVVEDGLPPLAAIFRRRTYRRSFADRPVAEETLGALRAAATADDARLEVLDDTARAAMAELVAEGDRLQFADARWRRELAAWMHSRGSGDGLQANPATRFVVRHFDVGATTAGKDAALATRPPVLAVLSTAGDAPVDWLCAGQALERVLLVACDAGLQASFLNQPVQVEQLRPRVAELLRPGHVPQLILRLGHVETEIPPAPRRPVDAVIESAP